MKAVIGGRIKLSLIKFNTGKACNTNFNLSYTDTGEACNTNFNLSYTDGTFNRNFV